MELNAKDKAKLFRHTAALVGFMVDNDIVEFIDALGRKVDKKPKKHAAKKEPVEKLSRAIETARKITKLASKTAPGKNTVTVRRKK